nr:MAG: hypothetical protein DIU78_10120 [Pseudomonadota bacterium]
MLKRFMAAGFVWVVMHAFVGSAGAVPEPPSKRGCCSWHKGVCGCSNGRVTCCDGTTSPSCTC